MNENKHYRFLNSPLLSIPYVVRRNILHQFTAKEHLTLRQVCRTTKLWIDNNDLLTNHLPVTYIKDYGRQTFSKFLEKKPPHLIRAVFIDNESNEFLFDPALTTFLQTYAYSVKNLRVKVYFTCILEKEMTFYESFKNLDELEFDNVSISSANDVVTRFPKNFKCLRELKIGSVKTFPEPPDDLFGATLIPPERQRPMGMYVWNLIGFCETLEFLGYPQTSKYFFQAFVDGRGRGEFGAFCDYIYNRRLEHPNEPNLKVCNLQNDNWSPDSKNALTLLKLGEEFGIKFLNVNGNLFQYIKIGSLVKMYDLPSNSGDCIHSFKNFNCLVTEPLPKVEKISLSASEVNTILDYSCVFNGPQAFPNLQEIEIIIDVGFTELDPDKYQRAREFGHVHILLSHFFYDMEMILGMDDVDEEQVRIYKNVQTLTIKFTDVTRPTSKKATAEDLPIHWVINGLPNLKKLKLIGWKVEREESYLDLWKGFPKLEELHLENCGSITEACIKEILNLEKLIRLTVKENDAVDEATRRLVKDNFYPSNFLNQNNHQGFVSDLDESFTQLLMKWETFVVASHNFLCISYHQFTEIEWQISVMNERKEYY